MGVPEIEAFLTDLAIKRKVAALTQHQILEYQQIVANWLNSPEKLALEAKLSANSGRICGLTPRQNRPMFVSIATRAHCIDDQS